METILTGLHVGVAVLDPQQRIQVWNRRAEDLWGTRQNEALDRHFLSLNIRLPTESLAPALRAVLGGSRDGEQLELQAVNRRGRTISCSVSVMPLTRASDDGQRVRGAIVLMEDGDGHRPVPAPDGRSTGGRPANRTATAEEREPPA